VLIDTKQKRRTAAEREPSSLELVERALAPPPPSEPQECPACGHMVQPAYIEVHAQGRDVNHPECPLFHFDTDDRPASAPKSDEDIMRMKF
jgi:hypothetical protein